MKRLFQVGNSGPADPDETLPPGDIVLSLFGKHPAWDDHMPGLGLELPVVAGLKQSLYVEGIGGQIDRGNWDRLEPNACLAGFDHRFLFFQEDCVFVGGIWSSRDGKGRTSYPLIACASSETIDAMGLMSHADPELGKLRDRLQRSGTPEQVVAAWRSSTFALRMPGSASGGGAADLRNRLLGQPGLGPNLVGLQRIMHELGVGLGRDGSGREPRSRRDLKPMLLRLPRPEGEATAHVLVAWAAWLRMAVPRPMPLGLLARADMNWIDAIVGKPIVDGLFCLRAGIEAIPLSSSVDYQLTAGDKTWTEECVRRFAIEGETARQESKRGTVGASPTPGRAMADSQSTLRKSRSWIWMGVGMAGVIGVLGILLVYLSQSPEHTIAQQALSSWSNRLANAEMQLGAGEYEVVRGELDALVDGRGQVTLTPDLDERLERLSRALAAEQDRTSRLSEAMAATTRALETGETAAAVAHLAEAEVLGDVADQGRIMELRKAIERQNAGELQKSWLQQLTLIEQHAERGDYALVRQLGEALVEAVALSSTQLPLPEGFEDRLEVLRVKVDEEESQLRRLNKWLAEGEYRQAVDESNQWPRNREFDDLLKRAEEHRIGNYEGAITAGRQALQEGRVSAAEEAVREARRWELPVESRGTEALLEEIRVEGQARADRTARLAVRRAAYEHAEAAYEAGDYARASAALAEHRNNVVDELQMDKLRERIEAEARLLSEVSGVTADPFEVMERTLPEKGPFEKVVAGARHEALRRLEEWLGADEFDRVLGALKGRAYAGEAEFARVLELPREWERMRREQEAGRTNEVRVGLSGLSAADQQRKPFRELAEWAKKEPREVVDSGAVSSTGGSVGAVRGLTVDEQLLALETLLGVPGAPSKWRIYQTMKVAPNKKQVDVIQDRISKLKENKLNEKQQHRLNVIEETLRKRMRIQVG